MEPTTYDFEYAANLTANVEDSREMATSLVWDDL